MKKIQQFFAIVLLTISFSSCSVVTGIFKAGMGVGIFVVLAILVLVVGIIYKVRNK